MSWAATARAQCGVISRDQLRGCGLSDTRIDGLITAGALEPLRRAVFVVRGAPVTYDARLWDAVLSFGGVLGFATAAHLWGVADQPPRIGVIVPRPLHLWRHDGVRTYRIDLPPRSVTRRHGLPVTTMRESVLDHLGRLPRPAARQLADRAIQRGWLRPDDFETRLRRQPGRTGNGIVRELAEMVTDGAAAESERVLHRLLRRAGITGWIANHDVWIDGELIGVLDVAIPGAGLAIEVDGFAHHHDPARFQRDRTKQNALTGLGWRVLRFTWSDLVDRPGYVIATIQAHLANSGSFAV